MFEKTGPRTKRKFRLPVAGSWSMISVPVMSLGIRSGVNWMRVNFMCRAWARVETVSVLASPGTPIVRQWPRAKMQIEHLLDHLVLADDHLVDFVDQRLPGLGDAANGLFGTHLGGGGWGRSGHVLRSWRRNNVLDSLATGRVGQAREQTAAHHSLPVGRRPRGGLVPPYFPVGP